MKSCPISPIFESIASFKKVLQPHIQLVAVSKTRPTSDILEAYQAGQRDFGENKVQEMLQKHEALPRDIRWHMIGHLQRNKVRQIIPFVYLIHSVDSLRLLEEIEKEASKINRVVNCLLQVHIATEETKFGFDRAELLELFQSNKMESLSHIHITGLMGMATFTENQELIRSEFQNLKHLYDEVNALGHTTLTELSMGMSGDYPIAIACGSTLIRVGSSIFGERPTPNRPHDLAT